MISWHRHDSRELDDCRHAVAMLQAYLDGELDERAAREIGEHVADCYECGLEADVYRQLRLSLREHATLPEDSLARLRAFVDAFEAPSN